MSDSGVKDVEDSYTLGWDSPSHSVVLKLNGVTVSALAITTLAQLTDVEIVNLTNADVLTWVAADGKWENKPGHP